MNSTHLEINREQLKSFIPYLIVWDEELNIRETGRCLQLTSADEIAIIDNGIPKKITTEILSKCINKNIVVEIKASTSSRIEGGLTFCNSTNSFFFLGTHSTSVNPNSNYINSSLFIDHLHIGILAEDNESVIVSANQVFCNLFNISEAPEAIVGLNSINLAQAHKYEFKEPDSFINNAIKAKQLPIKSRDFLELKDGRIIERECIPIIENNCITGTLWTFTDISVQHKIGLELERQKQFYEQILNKIPADIAVFDKEHRYIFLNPVAVKDAQLREWLIGKRDEDYCLLKNKPLEIARNRRELFNKVTTSKTLYNWEEELIDKNGNIEYHLRHMYPAYDIDGQLEFVIGYGLNITDRKKSEQMLRDSEEKYRSIINNMKLGFAELTNDGKISFVNQHFCTMCGYSEDELIGHNPIDLLVKDVNKEIVNSILSEAKNHFTDSYEIAIKDKHNKIKWWMISGTQQYDIKDTPNGSIGIFMDITDRKTLENAIKAASIAAEQSLKSKEIFFANMSHEIRTPINAILGISQILDKTKLNDTQKEYLKSIQIATEGLLVLINDVLDLTKAEAGEIQLENKDFSIQEVCKQVCYILEHKSIEKKLKLYTVIDSNISKRHIGDAYRLQQVLLNLVSNALKFTSKGEISVDVRLLEYKYKKELIEIKVVDTGMGINSEFLNRMFDKFSQENQTIAKQFGGTGLGLHICKQLVELMGGNISANSEPNKGTTITIIIPLAVSKEQHENPTYTDINEDYKMLCNKRVLIAEDNEINLLVASTILQHYKAVVTTVNNGYKAMEAVEQQDFDLILMDIQMPFIDGIEVTQRIRGLLNKKTPIVALTANAMQGEKDKCLQAGMNGFVTKPFLERQLINEMCRILKDNNQQDNNIDIPVNELYNLSTVEEIGRGNAAFVNKMLQLFISDVSNSVKIMLDAYKQGDMKTLKQYAHRLKPSISNMNITRLKQVLPDIEKNAEDTNQTEQVGRWVNQVAAIIEKIIEDIKHNRLTSSEE